MKNIIFNEHPVLGLLGQEIWARLYLAKSYQELSALGGLLHHPDDVLVLQQVLHLAYDTVKHIVLRGPRISIT